MGLKITKRLKTRDALVLLRDCPETFREIGEALGVKPYDRITFGQRADMTELVTISDLVLKPWELIRPDDCKAIRFKRKDILDRPFLEVFRFSYSVIKYLEQAAERDKLTFTYKPSPLEVKAGFNDLTGGMFSTLDRIATRMHKSHDDVLGMMDILVYSILKADYETAMYNRRLSELAQQQKK